jgi:hypothetical protein
LRGNRWVWGYEGDDEQAEDAEEQAEEETEPGFAFRLSNDVSGPAEEERNACKDEENEE